MEGRRKSPVNSRRVVFVIDDNKSAANALGALLGHFGYDVRVSYDGVVALERHDIHVADIVLLDIGLPIVDGYEIARRLREMRARQSRDLLLVAVSGYGREDDKRRSIEAGFDYHLVKPVDVAVLIEIFKRNF